MKKPIIAMSLGALALGLAGCAVTPAEPMAGSVSQSDDPYDRTYMAVVGKVARQRGVRVIWVNVPRRNAQQVRISYPPMNDSGTDNPDAGTR